MKSNEKKHRGFVWIFRAEMKEYVIIILRFKKICLFSQS